MEPVSRTQNHRLPRQQEASQEIDLCSSNELSRGWNPARESSSFSHVSHPPNVNCKHAVQNSLGHGDDQSQLKVRATLGSGGRGPASRWALPRNLLQEEPSHGCPDRDRQTGPWADLGEWRNHFPAWIWCKLWILKTFSGHFHFITDNLAVSIRADRDAWQTKVVPTAASGGGSPPPPHIPPPDQRSVPSDTDLQRQRLHEVSSTRMPRTHLWTQLRTYGERVQVLEFVWNLLHPLHAQKALDFSSNICLKITLGIWFPKSCTLGAKKNNKNVKKKKIKVFVKILRTLIGHK